MNPRFFTAPFYFAFIWFRVQGSRFRVEVAASPPFFLEDGILVSQPSPLGNAIKLSGRMSWLPIGGAPQRGEGAMQRYCMKVLEYRQHWTIQHSTLYRWHAPSRFSRNGVSLDFSVATLLKIQFACTYFLRHFPRRGKQDVTQLTISLT